MATEPILNERVRTVKQSLVSLVYLWLGRGGREAASAGRARCARVDKLRSNAPQALALLCALLNGRFAFKFPVLCVDYFAFTGIGK